MTEDGAELQGRGSQDRLFVPLKTEHYRNFEGGQKTWELRGINDQFNEDTARVGRTVELRRGYSSDDSLWGTIEEVETFDSLRHVPRHIARRINPTVAPGYFVEHAATLLGDYEEFIAFKVVFGERSVPQEDSTQ